MKEGKAMERITGNLPEIRIPDDTISDIPKSSPLKTANPEALKAFFQLLGNTLISSIINMTVWFALTFFVFLETRSVFATGVVAGIYLVAVTISGFWFGSLVDHNKKKHVMLLSSLASLLIYVIAIVLYLMTPPETFKNPLSVMLWVFTTLLLVGAIAGNIRTIALPTIVTMLFSEEHRDRANGLTGTTTGIAFLLVSVISGLLLGLAGMFWVLVSAITVTIVAIIHLATISIPEKEIVHTDGKSAQMDIRGTIAIISAIPGLIALIFFTAFNNFLGGVFMSLMDAYGLSIVSVEVWGALWGIISLGFIVGGLLIAKRGLGKSPLRTMFLANIFNWIICCVFVLQSSIVLLTAGMFLFLCIMPFIEASEQTILQKVVPFERLGRVIGFAQSVEMAASPLTAFLMGPIAQFIFIPFMTTGTGVDLIGGWFGTGPDRGIALLFIFAGIIGLLVTLLAMSSKYYRLLSNRYAAG